MSTIHPFGCKCGRCGPPPTPPPPRNPHHTPTWLEPGYRVLSIAAVLALGFLLGWIARGGQ